MAGTASGPDSGRRFQVASTRSGSIGEPFERRPQEPMVRVLGRRRRHQHQRVVARRRLDVVVRGLPDQRADDPDLPRPAPRVLELRERADQAQLLAEPAVKALHGPETELPPRVVELVSAPTQAGLDRLVERTPQRSADGRARHLRAERVRREAWLGDWVHVRDQRRDPQSLELGGERRRQRQDVVDDQVGPELGDCRTRLRGRQHDRLVRRQRAVAGREDRVLGGRDEPHSVALDVVAPP